MFFSGCLISTYLIDKVGRKTLLIVSGIGVGSFHAITAWSYYNTEHSTESLCLIGHFSQNVTPANLSNISLVAGCDHEISNKATYLPLIGLIGFYLTFAIGAGSVPIIILGEVFPPSVKGTAISLINSSMWILNFGMAKMFFFMNDKLGIYGTFVFFSSSSVAMTLYVFMLLPETKNKTLNEIQQKVKGTTGIRIG